MRREESSERTYRSVRKMCEGKLKSGGLDFEFSTATQSRLRA